MESIFAALILIVIIALYCGLPEAKGQGYTYPQQPVDSGYDLPLQPVRFGDPPPERRHELAPPADPPEDDPRDTPPPIFYGEEIDTEKSDSIVYVIDISGSMRVDGRMARAQSELIRSVSGLSGSLSFNVIAYSDRLYNFRDTRVPATPKNKAALSKWILSFNPHGYTATGPACARALSDRGNFSVVLLTDGLPNWGIHLPRHPNTPLVTQLAAQFAAHRGVIKEANPHGATIDVFGIAASGLMRSFCQAVSEDSGGSYYDVP